MTTAGGFRALLPACAVALVAGCASLPDTSPSDITLYNGEDVAPLIIEMTPIVESPPIEPVEPPLPAPPGSPAGRDLRNERSFRNS